MVTNEIIKAEELYKITMEAASKRIDKLLDGIFEKITRRVQEEAGKGLPYYEISLNHFEHYFLDRVLEEIKTMISPLEEDGYIVSIDDYGDYSRSELTITLSWDGKLRKPSTKYNIADHLYDSCQ